MKRTNPIRGTIYTYEEIVNSLNLLDLPSLGFQHMGKSCCVQDSHFRGEDLLKVEGWAGTLWRYVSTTSEWIPIFEFAGHADGKTDIHELVHIEPEIHWHDKQPTEEYWVTPKAFPRKQYTE